MALMKWQKKQNDPIQEFFEMDHPYFGLTMPVLHRFNNLLRESAYPAIDISESKDTITLRADLPGFKKDEIDISVDGSFLKIKGERKSEEDHKDKNYHRLERVYGVFERTIELGSEVNVGAVKAQYKDGVLEVLLPKVERAQAKQIVIE